MKEYIKMGIGFTIGMIITLTINKGLIDWHTGNMKENKNDAESKKS